jgi:4-methylaminobutanoate oxidase (formaldehyde-forming)
MDSLRIEKAYRSWGHDIVDVDTPLEAGLRFAVAFDKDGGFIGKDALLTQLDEGIKRRLAVFVLDDPEPILLGDEPIYRDGEQAGVVTSGEYGHTIGTAIGLGYVESEDGVTPAYIRAGTYEIEIATERFAAKVRMTAPYDPKGLRVHM